MKKRTLLIVLSVVLVAAAAVGATLAYFSATQTATNTFTVGNVKIELTEPAWTGDGEEVGGAAEAFEAYPGEPLAKDPTIENIGANPCLVRIKVQWPFNGITYRTNYHTGELGTGWYDGGDGYFYYLKPLEVGGVSESLFDQVVMPYTLTNGDALTEYNIIVTAQAVQAQGIFTRYAEMEDGISTTAAPAHGSPIGTGTEIELVKKMFTDAGF